MNKILFTEEFCQPEKLHPFTLTRQLQDIRVGILTIREKWERFLGLTSYDKKENDYKDLARSIDIEEAVTDGDCYLVHGNILPTPELVKMVKKLKNGECLTADGGAAIVYRFSKNELSDKHKIRVTHAVALTEPVTVIQYPWHIFQANDKALRLDFALLTKGKKSQPLSKTNRVSGREHVFVAKGARVEHCTINADTGPVYIGKNAELMEGSFIRGPFAIGEGACLKMGAKVYGATTIGPYCVAAGEIKNSVLFGYSNKAHDGYLGDSVIGEWCNMGAGTTNSNLKNNAGMVRVWTPAGQVDAGMKCGVLMGDYSRTAINTSINTGTVIGVGSNVFGSGLTPKYIPSFAWGSDGIARYDLDKAMVDIANWKKLKNGELSADETTILDHIYHHY